MMHVGPLLGHATHPLDEGPAGRGRASPREVSTVPNREPVVA